MADILNVSFKIDTGNLEGDAAAAGKLAAKAFEQGFGALDLKAVGQRISAGLGSGKAAEPAVKANDAAAEKHAAVRHGGDGGDGGEGERGGEGEGSPLHKGIEGLTAAMEGLTKLVEGGSLLAAAPALLSGLKGLGGSALDAGEGLAGISLLRRLAGRFGVGRASEDELEGVGTMFGGEQSAMAGAAGRMAALRRGEEKEVINQRLHDLGLGGVQPAVAAAGETGAAEGIAGAAAAAGGGLLGSLPGGGIGTAIGGAVGGPPGAVVGGVLGKLIGGAAGAFAITKLTEGAVKGAEAIKDVGLEAAHTDERLHNMAEIMGTSFEKFMRVREVAAKGGVDLDDWSRGITRLAIQTRKELPEVERQYEDSGHALTESNIKVKDSERGITEARLAREAATDQTKKAEAALAIEQELGPETREEQREAAALGVSGAAVGMEGAQFGLARAKLKLAFAPQEQAFGDITGPNAIANADVSIGGAVIRARQADIADREAHGERVSGAEKRQLRMDAADQALWAANQGVTNAQVAFRGAVLQNQERKAANDAGLGPEGQAELGYDQAVQTVEQAALAQKQAETQQKMVETMTRLADRMAGPEAQRAVEGAQTQEGKAADNQTQAAIAENRAKKDQRLFALYGDKPTVTQALQGKPPEMQPGEGDYDYSQIGPADLHAALLHRGAQMGGGAFGAINAMGEAIQKVSDLRPEEGTQFGLSAVSSLFPSLRGFRREEGPEALKHLVDLVNSPAARGPGGLAGALSPEDREELQPYIDLNAKKLPEARGLIEKERGAFATGEQQTQKTGLEAIPAAGAVVQTGEVGAKVGGGVAQAALGALNTAVSGIGNAFSGAAGIIGSGASSVGGALGALASKLSGWSPPAAGSGGNGGGGGGGHENAVEQAGGGLISGAGSGTSDSIPAWLSHGEYIVKADSVQKLGVPFLDRLNAGGFASGGLVRAYADGGEVDDDQAKRKIALEQIRLKMPLFGRGVFDNPDWASPLGNKIRLERANKIKPPAEVGGVRPSNPQYGGYGSLEEVNAFGKNDKIQPMPKKPHGGGGWQIAGTPEETVAYQKAVDAGDENARASPLSETADEFKRGIVNTKPGATGGPPAPHSEATKEMTDIWVYGSSGDRKMFRVQKPEKVGEAKGAQPSEASPPEKTTITINGNEFGKLSGYRWEGGRLLDKKNNEVDAEELWNRPVADTGPRAMHAAYEAMAYRIQPRLDRILPRAAGPAPRSSDSVGKVATHSYGATMEELNERAKQAGLPILKGMFGHDDGEYDRPTRFGVNPGETSEEGLQRTIRERLKSGGGEEHKSHQIRVPGALAKGDAAQPKRGAGGDWSGGKLGGGDEERKSRPVRVPGAVVHHTQRTRREDTDGASPRSAKRRHIAHVKSGWDPIYSPMPGASRHHYDDGFALGGLVQRFASGGLARVSNGEYRIRAGAVTKYGAGVMAMLNAGRFDSGGLVGGASNPGRFDDWGNGISRGLSASLPPGVSTQDHGSSSQHTLDLVTSAGQFRMQASQDTIEAIRSSAIGQKLTSAGTKPSWY